MVRFVDVVMFHLVDWEPVIVIVPVPIVSVLAPVPEKSNDARFVSKFARSSVPVNAPPVSVEMVGAYANVTVPPPEAPSKVTSSEAPGTD